MAKWIINSPLNSLLIWLNPKIRGWALFHRLSARKEIFNYVDFRIFHQLKHWMHRRHPRKVVDLVLRQIPHQGRNQKLCIEGDLPRSSREPRSIRLFKAMDVPSNATLKSSLQPIHFCPYGGIYFE
jgi:RNA-directed DNA polymerase